MQNQVETFITTTTTTTNAANNGEATMSQIATEIATVETNVVVQNDKSTIAVNVADKVHVAPIAVTPSVAEVRSRVAALIAERKAWEVGAYVASCVFRSIVNTDFGST